MKPVKNWALILARGGSKSLPGKNIIDLNGKPLIAWTITAALESGVFAQVAVSSDDPKILAVAKRYGALPIKRPKALSTDKIRPEPAMVHAIRQLQADASYLAEVITLLQPTSPLRTAKDIKEAVALMGQKNVAAVVSVFPIDKRLLKSFITDAQGYLTNFTKTGFMLMRRQDLPEVYFTNGAIYMVKTDYFLKKNSLFPKRTVPYIMTEASSYDVDTLEDLKLIRQIMRTKNYDK